MSNLTKKQKQILDFITEFIQDNEYAPSYREIADSFGLSSTATVHEHVKSLQNQGLLNNNSTARSLELIKHTTASKAIFLPLAGLITAGEPIEAIEEHETIAVPSDFVRSENSYVLKVRGESMIEDGIFKAAQGMTTIEEILRVISE